jgi:hypothetical protein
MTIGPHWGHNSGIDGNLRPMEHRQAISDDLNTAAILSANARKIEVPNEDIHLHPGTTLAANPGPHALNRAAPLDQAARPTAGSAMVTIGIQRLQARPAIAPSGGNLQR